MSTATGDDTVILFASKDNTLLKGDTIDSNRYFVLGCATDSTGEITNEHKYGQIQTSVLTDGTVRTQLIALKNVENNGDQATISVGYTSSGNAFTTAPTPASTDNSTQIATTAYVKSNLNDYLPLSGGTMTGNISSVGINHTSTSNPYAVKVVSPAINAHFGFDWASYNGGGVYFRGSDYNASAEKGNFTLYASKTDGTTNNRSTLTGTPTGVLTWTGTAKISGDHSAAPSSGGLTITGGKQNFAIQVQTNGVTKGTAPSATVYNGIEFYGNTMTKYQNRLGILEQSVSTANLSSITMSAYGCAAAETTTSCAISCNVDSSGTAYTAAPTPATTDSSTKIATTAYVKACVPKSIGSTGTPVYTNANGVVTACTVKNNTSAGACWWTSNTGDGVYLINVNTLAYWNGCYSGTSSNLAYCNKGAFGDMATKTASNYVATSGNQTIAGTKTFSGQVILSKNTGMSGTAANAVALIVGGAQTAQHLEFDGNEIMSKTNGTTVGTLYVGGGNGSVNFSTSATACLSPSSWFLETITMSP